MEPLAPYLHNAEIINANHRGVLTARQNEDEPQLSASLRQDKMSLQIRQ